MKSSELGIYIFLVFFESVHRFDELTYSKDKILFFEDDGCYSG
jgi:hypothetical protein